MTINLKNARDFVYQHGVLWERALFAYLFQDQPVEPLHHAWLAYKNTDGGYGNALEHDMRIPKSHPLALEFLLKVMVYNDIAVGDLLVDSPQWVQANLEEDGSLINPPDLLDYPHAPWWNDGGQTAPDSIVGNLIKLKLCSPGLAKSTQAWVEANLTLEAIGKVEWLFMNYHAYDYFMHVEDFPNLADYRQATAQNIIACAEKAPDNQLPELLKLFSTPQAVATYHVPETLVKRALDLIEGSQQADGGWHDEHGLAQWYAYTTITSLQTLKRFGRLAETRVAF